MVTRGMLGGSGYVALIALALLGCEARETPQAAPTQAFIPPDTGPRWLPLGPRPVTKGIGGDFVVGSAGPPSGRATMLAINPANPYNIFLATASGGVWVTGTSTVGGGTVHPWTATDPFDTGWAPEFFPLTDSLSSLAIGSLLLDESTCSLDGCTTLYVGTGENTIRRDTYAGDGVYRLTLEDIVIGANREERDDQTLAAPAPPGQFWAFTRLDAQKQFRNGSVAKMIREGSNLYVALHAGNTTTQAHSSVRAPAPPAGYGLHKYDGTTWTKLFAAANVTPDTGWTDYRLPTDLEKHPTNANTFLLGIMNDGIYRTTDGGTTWCALNPSAVLDDTAGDNITDCSSGTGLPAASTFDHVQIAVQPGSPMMYALFGNCPSTFVHGSEGVTEFCDNATGGALAPFLYRSDDGGTTWMALPTPWAPDASGAGHYSRYTNSLEIVNDQLIYGAVQLHVFDDNGMTRGGFPGWQSVHPDHHFTLSRYWKYSTVDDQGAPIIKDVLIVYSANDGGFYYFDNEANRWNSGNDSIITMAPYNIGIDYEDDPALGEFGARTEAIISGLQDNGVIAFNGGRSWEPLRGGDGSEALIHAPAIHYNATYDNDVQRRPGAGTNTTASVGGVIVGDLNDVAMSPPIVQHESSKRLYVGTDVVSIRAGNVASWATSAPATEQISPVLGGTKSGAGYPAIETDRNQLTAMAVAPSDQWRIYVGLYEGQVFRSNGGSKPTTAAADWPQPGMTLPGTISSLAVNPANANEVWATVSAFVADTVWVSTDGGTNWISRSPAVLDGRFNPAKVIKIDPDATTNLWLGTDHGVYSSTNSGATWIFESANLPNVPVMDIEIDRHSNRIFAATHGRGIWMLPDEPPVLTTYEGWTDAGIWDIPIYGRNFNCPATDPDGCNCTIRVLREDGTTCAESNAQFHDALDRRVFIQPGKDELITENVGSCTVCDGNPVAWACFNGDCVGNVSLASCNLNGHRVASVDVVCEGNATATGSVAGKCPEQSSPPPTLFEVVPPLDLDPLVPLVEEDDLEAPTTHDIRLVPTVVASAPNGGDRVLCSADLSFDSSDSREAVQLAARDAVNGSSECVAAGVTASLLSTNGARTEDSDGKDLRLSISAPGVTGSQLILGFDAPPGEIETLCFGLSDLGILLANELGMTQIRFRTDSAGAAGGDIIIRENTPAGSCKLTIPTTPGQSAVGIAAAITAAFTAPGTSSPATCRESANPRDIVQENDSIIAILPTSIEICVFDAGIGISVGPHGVPLNRPPVAQCKDKTVSANSMCKGSVVPGDVDNGSFDPDGDPITCTVNPSGPFGLGNATVTLTCTDDKGASDDCTSVVTVVDTTPPVLNCPVSVNTNCTSPSGAVATFSVTATDNCTGVGTPSCNPASGSTFALGTRLDTCGVSDAVGNASTCNFNVTVALADNPVCCPSGTTVILGTSTNNTLTGGSGRDCILGRGGQDTINGNGGDDLISGGDGDDIITGGTGNDLCFGGTGQDRLSGNAGNDVMSGGDNDDQCFGGDNNDTLLGGQGQDLLLGENGDDILVGETGDDRLEGGSGNDSLDGDGLHNVCIGGPGTNVFLVCESQTQ